MAYLVGKKQDGKTYYYLTESARVNGKPRIVSQQYLGSADEIAQRLSEGGPGEPDRSAHLAFGDVAAVWGMLDRLGVVGIIDDVVGSRRSDAAASVGTYIALAVSTGWSPRVRSWPLPSGGSRRPVTAWSVICPQARSTTGGSGMPWTPSPRTSSSRSNAASPRPWSIFRSRPLGPRSRHDQLRHVHRLGERTGTHRPTRTCQTKATRPAPGRSGTGGEHRRGDPPPQPCLWGQPS